MYMKISQELLRNHLNRKSPFPLDYAVLVMVHKQHITSAMTDHRVSLAPPKCS